MSFQFDNLDANTRSFMLTEVEADIANGTLYMSKRFSSTGVQLYPELLKQAVQYHDETWLALQLRQHGCFNSHETTVRGTRAVPITAADTFADGEFNRFYIRGVCARAIATGISNVEIYRAKTVSQPRSESQAIIGQTRSASQLLQSLRDMPGVEVALGLAQPNSGLSVRL